MMKAKHFCSKTHYIASALLRVAAFAISRRGLQMRFRLSIARVREEKSTQRSTRFLSPAIVLVTSGTNAKTDWLGLRRTLINPFFPVTSRTSFPAMTSRSSLNGRIRSPWQNGIAERWVGSCRREMLDHVIPLNEEHPRKLVRR